MRRGGAAVFLAQSGCHGYQDFRGKRVKVFLQALWSVPSFSYLAWVLAQGCGPSILSLTIQEGREEYM